jgi:hypothetical protein
MFVYGEDIRIVFRKMAGPFENLVKDVSELALLGSGASSFTR